MTGDPENDPPPRRPDGGRTPWPLFEEHRKLLFSIAYRMLGSVADAEDVLQEAFLRWQRASEADIRSPRAFLVTIVSRLCINQLQSAHARRETYVGEWLPEPLVTDPESNAAASRPGGRIRLHGAPAAAGAADAGRAGGLSPARSLRLQARRDRGGARPDGGQQPAAPAARPAARPADAAAFPGARRRAPGAARTLLARPRAAATWTT